jgi:hypothetical protein
MYPSISQILRNRFSVVGLGGVIPRKIPGGIQRGPEQESVRFLEAVGTDLENKG